MNRYAIMRVSKLKSQYSVLRLLRHCTREAVTPNADSERTPLNTIEHGPKTAREGVARLRELLPEKVRANGVMAIDYMIAASPEKISAMTKAEQNEYFATALNWVMDKHGAENVVSAVVHRDEKSPHMHVLVVPIDPRGKLNCRHFLGGSHALSAMQSEFANAVKHLGLERGIKGSKARNQSLKRYYGQVNAPVEKVPPIKLPEPTIAERLKPTAYAERVKDAVLKQVAPSWHAGHAKAKELEMLKARAAEKDRTLESHQKRYGAFLEVIDALALMNGGKRALDALQGVREVLEAQKKAQQEAEQETARKSRELLQKVSDNMCLADPTLHWYEAERQAEELAMDGRYEELQEWVDWEPVEPEPPVSMPSREKQPEVIKRPRDEGPDLGF